MYIYQSYTYLIGWSKHNRWYYGLRYGNKCSPEKDFWIKYFTSSKYVKEFRKTYGEPDVIQIRKKFDNYLLAIKWEEKVLSKLNIFNDSKWLNKNISGAIKPMIGIEHPRYGTITPDFVKEKISIKNKINSKGRKNGMFGKNHTDYSINLMKENRKGLTAGKNNPMYGKKHTQETIAKMKSKSNNKGSKNPMYGKKHTEQTKKLLSEKNKGENSSKFIGYYYTPWGTYSSAGDAARNSPIKISSWTVSRWCRKDNKKIISRKMVKQFNLLDEYYKNKTLFDIGFYFKPSMS